MEMLVFLLPLSLAPIWTVYRHRKRQSKHLKIISPQLRLTTNIFYASSIVYVIYAFYWATDQIKSDYLNISSGFLQIGISIFLPIILTISYWLIYFAVKAFGKREAKKRSERVKYFSAFIIVAALYVPVAVFYFTGVNLLSDSSSSEIYGVVYDQNNNPVSDVAISYELWHVRHGQDLRRTHTNAQGVFRISARSVETLEVLSASKTGYDFFKPEWGNRVFGNAIMWEEHPDTWTYHPKNNPAVYHAWKKTEAEPLFFDEARINFNPSGVKYAIDLYHWSKVANGNVGDIILSCKRSLEAKRGVQFDWSLTIEGIGGGLIETADTFMNEAPEFGYQSVWEFEENKGDKSWLSEITRKFYLQSRAGEMYGRLELTIIPYYNEHCRVNAKWWLNPNGSRNLQYDPEKRIYPK